MTRNENLWCHKFYLLFTKGQKLEKFSIFKAVIDGRCQIMNVPLLGQKALLKEHNNNTGSSKWLID